jgi:hypothetical protein
LTEDGTPKGKAADVVVADFYDGETSILSEKTSIDFS